MDSCSCSCGTWGDQNAGCLIRELPLPGITDIPRIPFHARKKDERCLACDVPGETFHHRGCSLERCILCLNLLSECVHGERMRGADTEPTHLPVGR